MNAYLDAYRRAFDFAGRSTRPEFWLFVLIGTLAVIAASLIDILVLHENGTTWLATLVSLAQFVPSISVTVRRLHDTGRSGWWYLIALVPLIGIVMLVVFLCGKSRPAGDDGTMPRSRAARFGGSSRAGRRAAAAGLGMMIMEAGDVAAAATELVSADADDGPDDGPDDDGPDTDFDMD